MTRAQCIVHREHTLLMVQHHDHCTTWWCLPGGGVQHGETPGEAALRELHEECRVTGVIVRETSHVIYAMDDHTITFLVDIGHQTPQLGTDPEIDPAHQVLTDMQWLPLSAIPERDRAFLWAAGLLGVGAFYTEVERWGDSISYPEAHA